MQGYTNFPPVFETIRTPALLVHRYWSVDSARNNLLRISSPRIDSTVPLPCASRTLLMPWAKRDVFFLVCKGTTGTGE